MLNLKFETINKIVPRVIIFVISKLMINMLYFSSALLLIQYKAMLALVSTNRLDMKNFLLKTFQLMLFLSQEFVSVLYKSLFTTER